MNLEQMHDPTIDGLVNTAEAAELLALSPKTLTKWRCAGGTDLAYVKMGSLVRYRLSDIRQYIAGRTRTSTSGQARNTHTVEWMDGED